MSNKTLVPSWVPDYLHLAARLVPADPVSNQEADLPAWLDAPPSHDGTDDLRAAADAAAHVPQAAALLRPLADLEISARLALLRLFPALHAAGLVELRLQPMGDPLLIEVQDRAAMTAVVAAMEALAKFRGSDGGLDQPTVLTWSPKTARDAEDEKQRFLQGLGRGLSGSAPLILVTTMRGSLPAAARDLPWQVVRSGPLDRDRIAALLAARATHFRADWTRIRDALPEDARLRGLGDLDLMLALRQQDTQGVVAALHRAARIAPPAFTLEDFEGYGPVVDTARRIAADLRAVAAGKIDPRGIPRNALFFGPPGTGKTVIAHAIAAAAGVPVVIGSLAEWQARGHLGDLLSAMFGTFGQAAAVAPAVLVIDEIDALGTRGGDGRNANYQSQVIAAMLQLLDGGYTPAGVTVIACCNHPDQLDPALQRPGRFDLKVEVDAPPPAALALILRRHLGADLPGIEGCLLSRLPGRTPADLAAAVRAARSIARGAQAPLSADHLTEALGLDRDDPAARWRIALHEAGHAVMAQVAGAWRIVSLTVGTDGGHMLREPVRRALVEPELMDELALLLAGRVAEILILGAPSIGAGGGAASDLARATMLARQMEQACGMGVDGPVWSPVDPIAPMSPSLAAAVRNRLEVAEAVALTTLEARRPALLALTEALCTEGHLTGERLAALLAAIVR
jgi:hypothetical protein